MLGKFFSQVGDFYFFTFVSKSWSSLEVYYPISGRAWSPKATDPREIDEKETKRGRLRTREKEREGVREKEKTGR